MDDMSERKTCLMLVCGFKKTSNPGRRLASFWRPRAPLQMVPSQFLTPARRHVRLNELQLKSFSLDETLRSVNHVRSVRDEEDGGHSRYLKENLTLLSSHVSEGFSSLCVVLL